MDSKDFVNTKHYCSKGLIGDMNVPRSHVKCKVHRFLDLLGPPN